MIVNLIEKTSLHYIHTHLLRLLKSKKIFTLISVTRNQMVKTKTSNATNIVCKAILQVTSQSKFFFV